MTPKTVRLLRLALKVLQHEDLRVLVAPNIDKSVQEAHAELDELYDENGKEIRVGRLISAKRAT